MGRINRVEGTTWVDVFSGIDFQGRLHRLRSRSSTRFAEFQHGKLPKFRSIIVGPGAIAEVHFHGGSRPITLSPKTMLPDTSRRLNGNQVLRLLVASAPFSIPV
jgi:hypothetical protein